MPVGTFSRQAGRVCIGSDKEKVIGQPAKERISTALVERQNLTMRMGMRRFTRLTNGFSKKIEKPLPRHFPPLHALQLLPGSQGAESDPAMTAGVADRGWDLKDLIELL